MKNHLGQYVEDAGCFCVKQDDVTGEKFWSGSFAGDKQGSDLSPGEPLSLVADNLPVGSFVKMYEPEDES